MANCSNGQFKEVVRRFIRRTGKAIQPLYMAQIVTHVRQVGFRRCYAIEEFKGSFEREVGRMLPLAKAADNHDVHAVKPLHHRIAHVMTVAYVAKPAAGVLLEQIAAAREAVFDPERLDAHRTEAERLARIAKLDLRTVQPLFATLTLMYGNIIPICFIVSAIA